MQLNLQQWMNKVKATHGDAVEFIEEDGTGRTYGDVGDWTARLGPDMQADIVGVYLPGEFCHIWESADDLDEEPTEYGAK